MKWTHPLSCGIAAFTLFFAAVGCDSEVDSAGEATEATASADGCPHEIKQEVCPFCNPELVSTEGFCGEHGVAEALCAQCRPYMKAAFRAKGDWCEAHKTPESQCMECNPELKDNVRPGEHGVPQAPATQPAETSTAQ